MPVAPEKKTITWIQLSVGHHSLLETSYLGFEKYSWFSLSLPELMLSPFVNYTMRNKIQWNLTQNDDYYSGINIWNVVCKMSAIFFRLQCVNSDHASGSAPGARLNIKMSSYQYRYSHYKDKTVSRPSYHYNGNTYIWKDSLYIETGPWCPDLLIYSSKAAMADTFKHMELFIWNVPLLQGYGNL